MLLVGLTGGIGAGKSTVARMLERLGAVVLDADELARRALEPGMPGHAAAVERFGTEVLRTGGDIDRAQLAQRVFTDAQARRDLEAIVHPEVFRLFLEAAAPYRSTSKVVVFDAPLILETGFEKACDVLVVVTAPAWLRTRRLVETRGMTEQDAAGRMRTQTAEREQRAAADFIVHNDGSVADLSNKVSELWNDLQARSRKDAPGSG